MKKQLAIVFVLLLSLTDQAQDIERFVTLQLQTYPKSRLLDIYKSCFQDYMGAEHLASDKARVEEYLDEELRTTSIDDLVPWYYEPCGIDSNYYRVSIKAVQEGLITEDLLLDAFVRSANSANRPTVDSWSTRWHEIIGTIDGMGISLPRYQEDRQYIDSILGDGKYAISHSSDYHPRGAASHKEKRLSRVSLVRN